MLRERNLALMNFYFSHLINKCILKQFGQKILRFAASNAGIFATPRDALRATFPGERPSSTENRALETWFFQSARDAGWFNFVSLSLLVCLMGTRMEVENKVVWKLNKITRMMPLVRHACGFELVLEVHSQVDATPGHFTVPLRSHSIDPCPLFTFRGPSSVRPFEGLCQFHVVWLCAHTSWR